MTRTQPVDEIDQAIVRLLQADGRQSYANIGDKLGLAPSTIQQRANRLFDMGLVRVTAVTDPIAMGVPVTAMIALKVENIRMREAANEINEFEEVGWVVICTGRHDILIEVACRDNDHLLNFISDKLAQVQGVKESEAFVYLSIIKNSAQWGVP